MKLRKIAVIDYGMGNIGNVKKAVENLGFSCFIAAQPAELDNASGAILPGVGAFGAAMEHLNKTGFTKAIREYVLTGRPFLGVCLGLQLLFETSEESRGVKGLSLLSGKIIRFRSKNVKIPHIGWNQIEIMKKDPILKGIFQNEYFYFVHSYYARPEDPSDVLTMTAYGNEKFTSGICRKNIYAFQFHPEKSQDEGLKIYKNFGKLCN